MTLVSPSQSNPGDTIEASDINDPVNQIAAVVNGNIDSTNISSVSGSKLQAGTVAASALDTNANVETRMSETFGNFVASGLVWSAISGLNATMTSGVVYINGKRLAVSTIASRTYTASKDTYVSVDVNGTVSYSEVANGAAAPSLPANSFWIARVVTNGSAITVITLGKAAKWRVYRQAAQTMGGSGTSTRLNFDSKSFDVGSNFDNTVNFRFVALTPGYYFFTARTLIFAAASNGQLQLWKNGSLISRGTNVIGDFPGIAVTDELQLTTGDYIEVYFSNGASATPTIQADAFSTYFSGHMVGAS